MWRVLSPILVIALLAYAAACAALFLFQRSLLYFPQPAQVVTPLVPVPGRSGVVASQRAQAGEQAVIYFGGNAEDVTQNLAPLAQAFPGHALYLMHYRGYGHSQGRPTEADIAGDALALFDQVRKTHPQVTVVGRSLGSGVALRLASQRPAARVVLVTPYDSIEDIAAERFALFPVRWLMRDRYASWRYVPHVAGPVTVIAAEHDTVIPRPSTDKLMTRFAPGRAEMHVLPKTGHNDVHVAPGYLGLLAGSDRRGR
ncbi:MAG TPA: alpha/beta fold hydrolase [Rhizobacter sp.]